MKLIRELFTCKYQLEVLPGNVEASHKKLKHIKYIVGSMPWQKQLIFSWKRIKIPWLEGMLIIWDHIMQR